jgi:hypothetical protein
MLLSTKRLAIRQARKIINLLNSLSRGGQTAVGVGHQQLNNRKLIVFPKTLV